MPAFATTAQQAISLVALSGLTDKSGLTYPIGSNPTFPDSPGIAQCVLLLPGGDFLSQPVQIPATCSTSALMNHQGDWIVTFSEYWDAKSFRASLSDPSAGTLQHAWTFHVAANGDVSFVGDQGNVPPQLAEVI